MTWTQPLKLVVLVGVLGLIFVFVWPPAGHHHPDRTRSPSSPHTSGPGVVGRWEPLGEPGSGGRITGMAIDPADPKRMLVAGDTLGVGLSINGGQSWEATTGFSSWEMGDFTWDHRDPSTVWVGSLSGPYKSRDGGRTWQSMRSGMPIGNYPDSAPVQKVLIDSENDQNMLALGGSQRQFVTSRSGMGAYGNVYASIDGGHSWHEIAKVGTDTNILDAVASANLQTVYLAAKGIGILRSTDGGHTWQTIDTGLSNTSIIALTIDPANSNTVWAAAAHSSASSYGVYRSGGIDETINGGQSWQTDDAGLPQEASTTAADATSMVSILRAGDGILYTADQGYLGQRRYESTDGVHWTQAGGSVTKFYPAAATPYAWASDANGDEVIGGTSDSLIISTNHGANWQDLDNTRTSTGWRGNGFSGLLGTSIAFDSANSADVYLSAFDAAGMLRSSDSGASWTRPTASWDQYDGGYEISVEGGNVYEVLGQNGVFNGIAASTNGGSTFTYHVGGTLPVRDSTGSGKGSVAIASADGATAYAALPNEHLYLTKNSGANWSKVSISSSVYAVSADIGRATYVATSRGIYSISAGGAISLISGSPTTGQELAYATGVLYVVDAAGSSMRSGLWADRSGTWTRLLQNKWTTGVAINSARKNQIAVVTNQNGYEMGQRVSGVLLSCNEGHSFSEDNTGLPMTRGLSVAFDPWIANRLVVGLDGRGFWQTRTRCPVFPSTN